MASRRGARKRVGKTSHHLRIGLTPPQWCVVGNPRGLLKPRLAIQLTFPALPPRTRHPPPSSSFVVVHPLPTHALRLTRPLLFASLGSHLSLPSSHRGYALKARGCPKSGHLRPTSTRSLEETALSLILPRLFPRKTASN